MRRFSTNRLLSFYVKFFKIILPANRHLRSSQFPAFLKLSTIDS